MSPLSIVQRIRACKIDIARLDPRGGMPVRPPPGALAVEIAEAERRVGFALPPSYRELLAHADGWPGFASGASLLGARQLTRGNFNAVARHVIAELEAGLSGSTLGANARGVSRLVPFGIDAEAETLFAWDREARAADGELEVVAWFGEVGTRLSGFPELLELVLEMHEADLDELRTLGRRPAARAASAGTSSRRAPLRAGAVELSREPPRQVELRAAGGGRP